MRRVRCQVAAMACLIAVGVLDAAPLAAALRAADSCPVPMACCLNGICPRQHHGHGGAATWRACSRDRLGAEAVVALGLPALLPEATVLRFEQAVRPLESSDELARRAPSRRPAVPPPR